MTSEIRANTLKNRVGLGTVSFTNTGIVVSGIVTANDLDIDGHTNLDNISVVGVSTFSGDINIDDGAADSAAGPELKLNRGSASPANADYLGQIKFAGRSSTGAERNYAKITGKILDVTNGSEDGILEFAHIKGGSQTITGRWRSDSLQLLNDTNLSVAGDTTLTGDLDVDGHTNLDNLSVAGVTTMTGALKISSTTDQMLELNSSDNNGVSLAFQRNGSRQGYIGYGGASNGLIIANETSNGPIAIQGNDGGSIINMLSFDSANKGLVTLHGGATIPLDLDVDGHTNLDNVSIAGVTTVSNKTQVNGLGVGIVPDDHMHLHISSANPRILIKSTGTNSAKIFFGDSSSNDPGVIEYSHTNNRMRFGTNNAEDRLVIESDGKMQTNTSGQVSADFTTSHGSGAYHKYELGASGAPIGYIGASSQLVTGTPVSSFGIRGESNIIFGIGNSEKLRIDSNGNVMIGRTSASKKFSIEEPSGSSGVYYLAQIGGSNHVSGYAVGIAFDPEGYAARTKMALVAEGTSQGYSRGKFHFLLDDANDSGEATLSESRMTITDAGNIGINRTNPSYRLHLHTPATDTTQVVGLAIANDGSGAGTGGQINMGAANGFESTAACIAGFYDGTGTSLIIKTAGTYANQSTVAERFRISNDGRITMGQVDSASSSVLHLRSDTGAETTLELSTKGAYNGSLPSAKISFTQQNGTEIARVKCDTNTGAANMADLTFWTNYGGLYERMRISKTGEVGIGRDSGGNINTRAVVEIACPFDDVSDNDGSADMGTNRHDAILLNIAGPAAASGKNIGSIAWDKGGRRRAAIMGEYQNTDNDYLALAFFTRGTDGSGDFYKSFIINHNGSAGLHGSLSQNTSDDRLKKDKVEIENALDKVNSLSSFTHKWNEIAVRAGLEEDKEEIGLSAQEVQGLYPSLVNVNNVMKDPENPDVDYLTVHYEKVVPLLVASIKELTAKNKALEARLDELENS